MSVCFLTALPLKSCKFAPLCVYGLAQQWWFFCAEIVERRWVMKRWYCARAVKYEPWVQCIALLSCTCKTHVFIAAGYTPRYRNAIIESSAKQLLRVFFWSVRTKINKRQVSLTEQHTPLYSDRLQLNYRWIKFHRNQTRVCPRGDFLTSKLL